MDSWENEPWPSLRVSIFHFYQVLQEPSSNALLQPMLWYWEELETESFEPGIKERDKHIKISKFSNLKEQNIR